MNKNETLKITVQKNNDLAVENIVETNSTEPSTDLQVVEIYFTKEGDKTVNRKFDERRKLCT